MPEMTSNAFHSIRCSSHSVLASLTLYTWPPEGRDEGLVVTNTFIGKQLSRHIVTRHGNLETQMYRQLQSLNEILPKSEVRHHKRPMK